MAEGLNRVMLLGNLGADPELRMTGGGQAVLKLRLATTESYQDKDRQRQERTEWHSVVVWGRRAEALSRILSKGSRLFIEGSLRTSSYDDRDGNKRYRTEIVAREIILAGGGGGGGAGPRSGGAPGGGASGGGAPRSGFERDAEGPAAPERGFPDEDYAPMGGDDDLPF